MQKPSLNYDDIAPEYNQRYPTSQPSERGEALLNLARQVKAQTILEVGSGTGFWLNLLHPVAQNVYGLDFSMGMIRQAKSQPAPLKPARGTAIQLPFKNNSFELVYCVNAIHHFGDYKAFIGRPFASSSRAAHLGSSAVTLIVVKSAGTSTITLIQSTRRTFSVFHPVMKL